MATSKEIPQQNGQAQIIQNFIAPKPLIFIDE
jgi:hypothetical protein